jgi:threonine aldolase
MNTINRRNFLKTSGLGVVPVLAAGMQTIASPLNSPSPFDEKQQINFLFDGVFLDPPSYISKLQEINSKQKIEQDFYGSGGVVTALEKKFAAITGKESAIYMPTGTMANQLAIHVLSGENTKVFVQDTSHVYRDEADAAQSVFNKRLIPLAKGEPGFTLQELQQAIEYYNKEEVFKSGIGVISIENPVRRNDGRRFSIEEIRKISAFCHQSGYKLHLDGARIYMASVWSGIPVSEFASYFDTVYISLYKYLGAAGGAILCGDKAIIDKMPHLIKIHGGTVFQDWNHAAIALYNLEGLEMRLADAKKRADELFESLNQLPEIKVTPLKDGTNIYNLQLAQAVDGKKFSDKIREYNILMGRKREDGMIKMTVNESILSRDTKNLFNTFKEAISMAKK